MLGKIRTVLIHNSHPGNIGAAARAMKNMGLCQLYLVAPKEFPSIEATARATSAKDILENAVVVSHLEQALQGCHLVLGTSSRERSLSWPILTAREAAKKVIDELNAELNLGNNFTAQNELTDRFDPEIRLEEHDSFEISSKIGNVAVLYGCEQSGLSNEELQQCHAQIIIPTNEKHASLNLAQAVQIISYELWVAAQELSNELSNVEKNALARDEVSISTSTATVSASFEEMSLFYEHLEQTLVDIHFLDPKKPGLLMQRLRRLFGRARPDKIELNILRGILTTVLNRLRKL